MPTAGQPLGQGVRGIADAGVKLLAADVPGTNNDVLGIKSLSVEVTSDSDEQRGDDSVLMVVQENKALDISMAAAYANLDVLAALTNTVLTSVSPGLAAQVL